MALNYSQAAPADFQKNWKVRRLCLIGYDILEYRNKEPVLG